MLFSFVNGLTLSAVLLAYTYESIATTFLVTAGTFGATSLFGYVTKKDLSSMGNFLFMALIGLIIASVVNMFLASSTMGWIITYVGILIFVGLTAYDTQKIKRLNATVSPADGESYGRLALIGALMLYLDFVNLFLLLLRVMGGRRN
jgi:FtsH-binding integral membrane protein